MNADEWSEIHRCHADGESIKGIAQRLGMSRNTVRRALSLSAPPADRRRRRGSVADDVDAQVRHLLVETPDISIAEVGRRVGWVRSRTVLARKVSEIRNELDASVEPDPDRVRSGITKPATSFVGRREELRELRVLLGEQRLVSVVGPGGVGKTRLCLQAADEFRRAFPDGVRFVELASLRSPSLLAQALCDALALDNRDSHNNSPEDTVIDYLRRRRMLLVLDNCEHVIEATAELVSRLLDESTALRILATTREYLSVPGEYVFHLGPLPTGGHGGSGAMELFAGRAAAVLSGFTVSEENITAVQRICERLDGLPLAIELACARLTALSVDDLADLLDQRLSLLTVASRGRSPRQRSLQATIDWSYDLCTEPERVLWARLSVFADGFDLTTATRVCGDDDLPDAAILDSLSALVAKSVISRDDVDARARFRMLETIREYGQAKLAPTERSRLESRLLRWCAEAIHASASDWYGPRQLQRVRAIRHNRGNIRAALHTATSKPHAQSDTQLAADALGAAMFLWACGISVREHRMWLTRALDLPGVAAATKGRMLGILALVQTLQGDRGSADHTLHRARIIAEQGHDRIASAYVGHISGLRDFFAGDFERADTAFAEAAQRYRECDAPSDLGATLDIHRAMLMSSTLDIERAHATFEAVHAASVAVGESWFRSYATYGLGLAKLLQQDYDTARDLAASALQLQRPFDDVVGTTLMTDLLGWAEAGLGSATRASVLLGAASSLWDSIGRQLYGSDHWIGLRTQAVETARKQVGDNKFDKGWERGKSMSTSDLLDFVFHTAHTTAEERPESAPGEVALLSTRERQVADLVVAGMTNKQIAEKLVLSPRTVEGHVEHILQKLDLRRRVEIVSTLTRRS